LRWLALPMLGLLWLPRAAHLSPGEFEVHLLDVGQGLGTVVETRRHTLVFDTGPEYPSGFSAAAAVIRPFLASRGRSKIDRLILSHGDKDHAGGVADMLSTLAVQKVQSGEPERVGHAAERCVAGERWRWDGVDFEFLHPLAEAELSGNDASCVLRISNSAGSVLFTGDIGTGVERLLVRRMPEKLESKAVVAPHHGSRSSSSAQFVAATAPVYVLYSTGWANRYRFPAPQVAARWRAAGALALDTAPMGTIGLRFAADGTISGPTAHRLGNKRFWWHDSGLAEPMHAVSSDD
jgi:competence protein ComEC